MKWNYNDTKYVLKKVIILILSMFALFIFGTWKAQALSYTINKPSSVMLQLKNEPDDSSYSFISNNNITNLSFIGDYRYWDVINYNNSNRLYGFYAYADFQELYEYQIIEFRFGMDVNILGDIQDIDIRDFYVEIPNYVYQICGIQNRTLEYRIGNQATALYDVHCVASQPIQNINATFQVNSSNYSDKHFFIGENIKVRGGTEEEIKDIINQILDEQARQYEWLANSTTTGSVDDSNNFWNNPLFQDNTGLQAIISLPLNMLNNMNNQCQSISLPLPFIAGNATLPCMSTIYQQHFSTLYALVSVVVNGFFVYRILLKMYEIVHDAKDPAKDKLEVVEL